MADPRATYLERLNRWDREIARGLRRHDLFANLRLATVALAVAAVILAARGTLSWNWTAAPAAVFLGLAIVHDRAIKRTDRARRARALYERGVARIDGTWRGDGADGARFAGDCDFAADLDLFGSGSLFQLLSTARTEAGEETLARWLCRAAARDEILARQAAVAELAPQLDFRENIAVTATGLHIGRTSAILRWATLSAGVPPAVARAGFSLLTAGAVVVVAGVVWRGWPASLLLFWFVVQTGIALAWGRRSAVMLAGLDNAAPDLAILRALLHEIEAQDVRAPKLVALGAALPGGGDRASTRIARLQGLLSALDSCRNQLIVFVTVFFQIPCHLMVSIERWRIDHGHAIADWLRVVGEFEALASLAAFSFEHPRDPFPGIAPDNHSAPIFAATALAHPLIHESRAVPNDLSLGAGHPHVLIVSGSNMSGKSTLLRAVGVNVVLANAGATVRAAQLTTSRLAIGATLRVEDSLQDGISRFYAEVLRIRSVVDLTTGEAPLLFLLDEIFAGTNSYDRRIGAEAVIRTLAQSGAIGLVTTHDLALTEAAGTLGVPAANVHFEDRIEDGKMVFDYRMRAGVVEHSNALALMRAVGLRV